MKKRALSVLLASAMLLGLTACGGSAPAPAATTAAAAPAKTEAAAPAETKAEAKTEAAAPEIEWPVGTIDVIIPGKAGSNTDLSARILMDYLTKKYPKASFNPINEDTGNGTMASELCRTAKPDGSTIYMTGSGNNIMFHQGKYKYSVLDPEQFTIIARGPGGNGMGSILLTQPDKPYNNLEEFVAYCKEHPGEVSFATNTGTTQEIKVKLLAMKYDLPVKWVIASGNDLVTGLLAGNIDVGLQSENKAVQYIEKGDLKGIVNNCGKKSSELRNEIAQKIETYGDLGLEDILFTAPMYIIGPGNMDEALVQKINSVLNEVEADEESQAMWDKMNSVYIAESVDEIRAKVKQTDEDVAKVIGGEIAASTFQNNGPEKK